MIAGLYGKNIVCKKLPNCLLKYLCHFEFSLVMNVSLDISSSIRSETCSSFNCTSLLLILYRSPVDVVVRWYEEKHSIVP